MVSLARKNAMSRPDALEQLNPDWKVPERKVDQIPSENNEVRIQRIRSLNDSFQD
jgi:hypothetical protein